MRDRRRAVLLLLATREDGFWFPAGSTRSQAGLAPGLVEPCRGCGGILLEDDFGGLLARRRGRGVVLDRFGREQECPACGGAGVVARDRMDSAGARVGSSGTRASPPAPRTVACDACAGDGVVRGRRCERCAGEGRRLAHLFELRLDGRLEGERDPVDVALDARAASGSYRELDRVLERLRQSRRDWWRGLLGAVDAGSAPLEPRWEPALAWVVERMPVEIRVPGEVIRNGRELDAWRKRVRGRQADPRALGARDQEIRRLLRRGSPVQWVAREYGLSVAQVYRVRAG